MNTGESREKKVKTFRINADVENLLERAKEETGLSEGELINQAILGQIGEIVMRYRRARTLPVDKQEAEEWVKSQQENRGESQAGPALKKARQKN